MTPDQKQQLIGIMAAIVWSTGRRTPHDGFGLDPLGYEHAADHAVRIFQAVETRLGARDVVEEK